MSNNVLFMTGAGGFLGKRLLGNYLCRDIKIYLLAQEKFLQDIKSHLQKTGAEKPLKAGVELICGDITQAGLGLEPKTLEKILGSTTTVLHLAAAYSLALEEKVGRSVNVDGTRNLLDVLQTMPLLERFGYLSTTAISGTHTGVFGEGDFDVGQGFKNFYEKTKFEAERLVRERMKEIPTVIFRPTIVVGDSLTGEMEKIDGPYYGLVMISRKLHFILQKASHVKCHIEPVDFVTNAITVLMDNKESTGKTLHLADPRPLDYDSFFDLAIERWGTFRPLLRIPARFMDPMFCIPGFSRLTGVPRESFRYTMTPVTYGTETAEGLLKNTNVSCPPVSSYIDAMIRYFREKFDNNSARKERW